MLTQALASGFYPGGSEQQVGFSWSTSHMRGLMNAGRSVDSLVEAYLAPLDALSGKAYVSHGVNGVTVSVPYWLPEFSHSLPQSGVNSLGGELSSLLSKPVHLDLVRLLTPLQDSNTLARFLSQELSESTFQSALQRLFTAIGPLSSTTYTTSNTLSLQPGALVGIKVRLAGRLLKEASRPRQTVQSGSLGTFTLSKYHTLQSGSYTATNQKGSYTVKVWLCLKL
jgi:hypothetical protein